MPTHETTAQRRRREQREAAERVLKQICGLPENYQLPAKEPAK